MELGILNYYPLGVGAVILIIVLLISLEIGYRLGKWTKNRQGGDVISGSRDISMGSMFALMGLIIAFTYAFAVSRADHRKQDVIDEANAIGSAFLRANLASEPERSELQRLLLNYARTRIIYTEMTKDPQAFKKTLARTMEAHSKLWPATERILREKGNTVGPLEIFIAQAMNEVLDMHLQRSRGVTDHLPNVALFMLVFIASASLAVAGFNAGLTGSLNRWRMTTFTSVLAVVMLIIIDFDLPQRGFIGVSQAPLVNVIDEMETSFSATPTSRQP